MDDQTMLNIIYDLVAQNPVKGAYGFMGRENDMLTDLVDHVDTERNAIVFIDPKTGREFELQLVHSYAPAPVN